MEQNERILKQPGEAEAPIQLVLNDVQPESVRLSRVFWNMKQRRRLFAWILVLCILAGFCLPLILYPVIKQELTVASVVTLRYDVPKNADSNILPEEAEYVPVTDLTAPDGGKLDLNQITSSYVLQTALDGMTLSQPITANNLRTNIRIQTVMTEESRRTQEALAGLAEIRNAGAYTGLTEAEILYENRFVVSLTNGFMEEGSENPFSKKELKPEELQLILDRVLFVYNDYLVRTYAGAQLPEDQFSVIDVQAMDLQDSLDRMRSGLKALEEYGKSQTAAVQGYRSWKTGKSLADWTETAATFRNICVEPLFSEAAANNVTAGRNTLLTEYRYLLRDAKTALQMVEGQIQETAKTLKSYKNDNIFITMQESDGSRSTSVTTEYYNRKMGEQAENYKKAAELRCTAADYERRVRRLESGEAAPVTDEMKAAAETALAEAKVLYAGMREHMEEVFRSALYTGYAEHSTPQGKERNFLVASLKKLILGTAAGAVIGFGIWFLAGLWEELRENREGPDRRRAKEPVQEAEKEGAEA